MKKSKQLTLRCRILAFLTHQIALPILKITRKAKPLPHSLETLQSMPIGTVGRDLIDYAEEKDIAILSHYARHDMKHLLLGYDTSEEGEICMQCFMFGNGRISFPVLITVAFGLVFTPEYWQMMQLAYQMGKDCNPIYTWDWMQLLTLETEFVKSQIFKPRQ
ncbi:Coq4 family protein [Parasediminibacterium paludis]|uniref:Coq4 family protein n=1 Tax=Parasediminibacterium paludis TaxID=908966 RepID=A0ABV8PXN7_9BACT